MYTKRWRKQNGRHWSETLGMGEDCIGRQGPQWTVALDDDDDDDDNNNNNMMMMIMIMKEKKNKNMKSTMCARHCDALPDISALPCLSKGTHDNV